MRGLLRGAALAFLSLLAAPAASPAQDRGAAGAVSSAPASVADQLRDDPTALPLPPGDSIRRGATVVPAGSTVGRIAVGSGTLEILGTVTGDAIALDGTVIVRPGGHVLGNIFTVRGRTQVDSGGRVDGEIRSLSGDIGAFPALAASPAKRPHTTLGALQLALAWFGILLVLGIGVLVLAGDYLDGVLDTLERGVTRSLVAGLLGQLAIVPAALVLVIALAITLIGALLIPFAIVAYCIAIVGMVSLGFLAAALLTGHAATRRPAGISERGASLRALMIGVAAYMALWVLAAAFTWQPVVGAVLRTVAFAVTWVVATAGFGAALLSRAGTRRATAPVAQRTAPPDDFAWQTPTPVTGIAAARRPTPAPPPRNPAA